MLYGFIFAAVAVFHQAAQASRATSSLTAPFDLQETPPNWCFFSPTRFNSASISWQPAGAALPFTVVVGRTTEPGCRTLTEIPTANECFNFDDGSYGGDFAVVTASG
ncbi:hypothetical protein C8Q80DRAFT_1271623 [Daedaleopsis nitida]|nr:hypothetical protein C8Q80DRAFT_1271623 [Daedaleopsis nitida]